MLVKLTPDVTFINTNDVTTKTHSCSRLYMSLGPLVQMVQVLLLAFSWLEN
jgi:hypothetical protein